MGCLCSKTQTIAVIGAGRVGKTTLFKKLTGGMAKKPTKVVKNAAEETQWTLWQVRHKDINFKIYEIHAEFQQGGSTKYDFEHQIGLLDKLHTTVGKIDGLILVTDKADYADNGGRLIKHLYVSKKCPSGLAPVKQLPLLVCVNKFDSQYMMQAAKNDQTDFLDEEDSQQSDEIELKEDVKKALSKEEREVTKKEVDYELAYPATLKAEIVIISGELALKPPTLTKTVTVNDVEHCLKLSKLQGVMLDCFADEGHQFNHPERVKDEKVAGGLTKALPWSDYEDSDEDEDEDSDDEEDDDEDSSSSDDEEEDDDEDSSSSDDEEEEEETPKKKKKNKKKKK